VRSYADSEFRADGPLTIGLPGTIVPPFEAIAGNARRSEAAGASAIWFPDHLMGFWPQSLWTPDVTPLAAFQPNPHAFFDPFVAMAAAAPATSTALLGTAVTQPLSRHPAHLAQALLTLSHQTHGRAVLGLGTGEAENLTPYGVSFERAAGRVAEALAIIRLLWRAAEPVSFDGDHWQLRDAVLGLGAAPGAPLPPVWLAAHRPRMLRLTGAEADGWLPIKMAPARYAQALAIVRGTASAAGRDPEAVTPAAWGFTVVDERQDVVDRLLEHPLIRGVCLMFQDNGFRDYIPSRWSREDTLAAIGRIPPELVHEHLFAGTPDGIVAQLRDLGAAGMRHAVLWNITFLADPALAASSFSLLAKVIAAVAPLP
jgi:phthiodiolone/phenolphthiodiolone dimycocerosates ketoreductase